MACKNKLHYETVTPLLKETLGMLMAEEQFAPVPIGRGHEPEFALRTSKMDLIG